MIPSGNAGAEPLSGSNGSAARLLLLRPAGVPRFRDRPRRRDVPHGRGALVSGDLLGRYNPPDPGG